MYPYRHTTTLKYSCEDFFSLVFSGKRAGHIVWFQSSRKVWLFHLRKRFGAQWPVKRFYLPRHSVLFVTVLLPLLWSALLHQWSVRWTLRTLCGWLSVLTVSWRWVSVPVDTLIQHDAVRGSFQTEIRHINVLAANCEAFLYCIVTACRRTYGGFIYRWGCRRCSLLSN